MPATDLMTNSASSRGDVRFVDSNPASIPYRYSLIDASDIVHNDATNTGAGVAMLNHAYCRTYNESLSYGTGW